MKSLKLKDRLGQNVTDFCGAILVDAELLESDGSFNPDNLGYIICIFQDISDSRFHLWKTQKYKDVMEFIKKFCLCDKYVMQPNYIITYGYLVQEAMCEYHIIVDSKRW